MKPAKYLVRQGAEYLPMLPLELGGTRMHALSRFTEEQLRELDLRGLHLGRMDPRDFVVVRLVIGGGGLGPTNLEALCPVLSRSRRHVTVVLPSGELAAQVTR